MFKKSPIWDDRFSKYVLTGFILHSKHKKEKWSQKKTSMQWILHPILRVCSGIKEVKGKIFECPIILIFLMITPFFSLIATSLSTINQIIRRAKLQGSGLQRTDCSPEQQAAPNEDPPLSPRLQWYSLGTEQMCPDQCPPQGAGQGLWTHSGIRWYHVHLWPFHSGHGVCGSIWECGGSGHRRGLDRVLAPL